MANKQQIYLELSPGVKIPALGLGTWQALDDDGEKAIDCALEAGYRHIDTAYVYQNEKAVGNIIKKWLESGRIKREDLFVVTKLPKHGNRPSGVPKYLQESLDSLGLSYVDLYLIHSPFGFQDKNPSDPNSEEIVDVTTDHIAIWKAMEDQVINGKARAIGLSNFNERQIERVWSTAERIKPSMLQVELHLYFQQKELVEFCNSKNIKVCAYSPLGSPSSSKVLGKEVPDILNNETVTDIAKKYGKTTAQILLRHIIQQGIAAIPKSSNPKRIKENMEIFDFELSSEDINKLNALDQGKDGRLFDFSIFKGATTHPEYPF
ncbi:1,5-anhydro-D-fructose reductase-like [Ischnura elegans]|uniref:1,5-anhydro-D-fructose reductase-like n=1 Tax=Ischnura elegans TaxID=197161 RepID=UPI001ED8A2BF|nr:1,5-anhydro-D-fructose reductase-like [Ischnura elegans]